MNERLKQSIAERLGGCPGRVGFYYKNLTTGEAFGIREDEAFQAASVIKLPIFAVISRMAAQHQVSMDEKILVRDRDKLPSCGALNSFTGDVTVDIRTLCSLMITLSDNTATNVLIRRFGISELNRGFAEIGIETSRIYRLLFDAQAAAEGKENLIVPREMGDLLSAVAEGRFVDEETSLAVKETLLKQQINHKLCGKIGDDVPVAHKTGEDDGITNDVGIVYAKQPFVVCFASNETDVPAVEQHIREITWELYQEANA